MKKLLLIILLLSFTALSAYAVSQKLMSVQVKSGQVRSTPSFMGKIIDRVAYGVRVSVSREAGGWAKVAVPGRGTAGWMHTSALTEKKIVMKPSAADVRQSASGNEIALAGKGFNREVEREYQARNSGLDYSRVNVMEQIVVTQAEIQKFVEAGGLGSRGGAQ